MASIIEQRAGVKIGQWVETKTGRIGIVTNLRDGRDICTLHGDEVEAIVMVPEDGRSIKEAHGASTLEPSNPRPWIGMEATKGVGSDRYPFEVVEVSKSGTTIKVRPLTKMAIEGQGMYDEREGHYAFASNPEAETTTVSFRCNGRWVQKGQSMKCCGFSLGFASYYNDPCF